MVLNSLKAMFGRESSKVAVLYLSLQAVIWLKCIVFFALFGAGRVMYFNAYLFPAPAVQFNFFFHEAMHVAIAVLALLFGKNLQRIEWLRLLAVVFIAVALHNAAYWFTGAYPGARYIAFDFSYDSVLLLAFVLAGYSLKKFLSKRALVGAEEKI